MSRPIFALPWGDGSACVWKIYKNKNLTDFWIQGSVMHSGIKQIPKGYNAVDPRYREKLRLA